MNDQIDLDHNFIRGLEVLETRCDDISWLIRLWMHIDFLGDGQPYVEDIGGLWYQGLESHVKRTQ